MDNIIGYKTEDGYTFLFNSQGELTDGDLLYENSEALMAWVDATPIKLDNVYFQSAADGLSFSLTISQSD